MSFSMFSLSMFGPFRCSVFRGSVLFEVRSFDVRSLSRFGLSMFGPIRCSVFRCSVLFDVQSFEVQSFDVQSFEVRSFDVRSFEVLSRFRKKRTLTAGSDRAKTNPTYFRTGATSYVYKYSVYSYSLICVFCDYSCSSMYVNVYCV